MTKVQICNLALAKIGAQAVVAIDENSVNAEYLRTHYDSVLAELLRAAPWSFAIARVMTAKLAAPAFGWANRFQLPIDCIQVLEVNGIDSEQYPNAPFAVEGGAILTNEEDCKLRYVRLETDPNAYPSDFVEAFATLLAARVTVGINGNWQLAASLEARCLGPGGLLPKASRQNGNESMGHRNNRILESDLIRARYQ